MTTDPVVESVWVIPGANGTGQVQSSEARDEVWMIVKRTINGSTKRYVEVLERDFEHGHDQEDAYYADSLITYDQPLTVTNVSVAAAVAGAVTFDGTAGLFRDTGFVAGADSPYLLVSAWLKPTYPFAAGFGQPLLFGQSPAPATNPSLGVYLFDQEGSTYSVLIFYYDALGVLSISGITAPLTLTGGWQHYLLAIDAAHADPSKTVVLYIDDAPVAVTLTNLGVGSITFAFSTMVGWNGFTDGGPTFTPGITGYYEGSAAEIWYGPGQNGLTAGDIAEATRRKFITAGGKAVAIGGDGSSATGTAPAVYLSGSASEFPTNAGTGGAMTLEGALSDSPDTPY